MRILLRVVWFIALVALLLGAGALVGVVSDLSDAPEAPGQPASSPAPAPGTEASTSSLRFALLGDPEDAYCVFGACLRQAQEDGCDFVMIAGDLAHRPYESAFRLFLSELETAGYLSAFAVVRGNHDDEDLYRRFFGSSNYWFRFGGACFVGVDTVDPDAAEQAFSVCREALAARGVNEPFFVMMHHPLMENAWERPGLSHDTRLLFEPLLAQLRGSENVGLLAGHFHGFREARADGLLQVTTGGAGGSLQEPGPFHFVEIDLSQGKIEARKVIVDPGFVWPSESFRKLGMDLNESLLVRRSPVGWLQVALLLAFLVAVRPPASWPRRYVCTRQTGRPR